MKLEMWEGSVWMRNGEVVHPTRKELSVSGAPSQGEGTRIVSCQPQGRAT